MNKIIVFISVFCMMISCKTKEKVSQPALPFHLLMTDITIKGYYLKENSLKGYSKDSVYLAFQYDFLKEINKDIELKNGQISLKKEKLPFVVEYAFKKEVYDSYQTREILVENKYFQQRDRYKNLEKLLDSITSITPEQKLPEVIPPFEEPLTIKEYSLDEELNIDGKFIAYGYHTTFKKGAGYWKDFYNEKQIKEEGQVKNNFKIGEWKYYKPNGTLDSLKTYTLRDSVDVRFPHCLFNKNEPCY